MEKIMITFLAVIVVVDIVAGIIMLRKFFQIYKVKKSNSCRPLIRLSMYLGATWGILIWGYIISFIIYSSTGNVSHFLNSAIVCSTVSIIPCVFGANHTFNIYKKCNYEKCVLTKSLSGSCNL